MRKVKNKPDYGMAKMDRQLEEVIGNKLELARPLIDSYLKEIGRAIGSKLSRSKATGFSESCCSTERSFALICFEDCIPLV